MKFSAERVAIQIKTRIILKAAKKKVTEVKKTMMAERKAKKKPKKTTGSLAIVSRESREGLTSQLVEG